MLVARVLPDSRWKLVTSCAGAEFSKLEWRQVPLGREEEALQNPLLEVKVIGDDEVPPAEKPDSKVEAPVEPIKASSQARELAQEAGIDLSEIEGSGRGGLITKRDVNDLINRNIEEAIASVSGSED